MANATDLSRLRKLEEDKKEHDKTSTKLKSYATGALNAVPFLNQSGISYPGPKEYAARGKELSQSLDDERASISKGKRDYEYKEGNKLPEGMIEKKAKGGSVKGWGIARGSRKAKVC
jgi:hypothetical protein